MTSLELESLIDAVKEIKTLKPSVVFLDVQMPKYAGYEIVNFFERIDFDIIFVTAYDQYAIRAFELSAMDYLVKPIERPRLSQALKKLENKVLIERDTIEYNHLLNSIQNKTKSKLIIPEVGNRKVLNLEEIIALEANGSYTKFYMMHSDSFIASKNLKYFENRLKPEKQFFRTHRTHIINLEHIVSVDMKLSSIILQKNIQTKIARGRIAEFEKIFN